MDEGLLPGETPGIYKPRPDAQSKIRARDLSPLKLPSS